MRNTTHLVTIPSSIITDSGNIVVLKISRNGDTVVALTRYSNSIGATTLQVFRLSLIDNSVSKLR